MEPDKLDLVTAAIAQCPASQLGAACVRLAGEIVGAFIAAEKPVPAGMSETDRQRLIRDLVAIALQNAINEVYLIAHAPTASTEDTQRAAELAATAIAHAARRGA